jgi:uncharacterized protein
MPENIFLSAAWEYLAMLNYEVDPAVLKPYLPIYTEIDLFEGKALVSIVGFLFNNTKVAGIKWPGYTDFEEVNLRFYVKHFDGNNWKRGVAFVSEIVPKPIIARIANLLYNEHYSTAKMFHNVTSVAGELHVEYNWKMKNKKWNSIEIKAATQLHDIIPLSEEAFIFEHYFGYNQLNQDTTIEYAVEHPHWQIYPVHDFSLTCDVEDLYGSAFVPFIKNVQPHSVFLAHGSDVIVRKPVKIKQANAPAFNRDNILQDKKPS